MAPLGLSYYNTPLDLSTRSIRLLRFGKQGDDRIICDLNAFNVNACPLFMALSYAWGPPHPTHEIMVNGQPFLVGENLWHALQTLAELKDDTRHTPLQYGQLEGLGYIWIDAICINQEDVLERGHQVNMMKDIFSTASLVIAWLGDRTEESALLFDEIREIRSLEKKEVREFLSKNSDQRRQFFFDRPYWERMWVVQEFLLARDILLLCGTQGVSWSNFKEYLDIVHFVLSFYMPMDSSESWEKYGISQSATALYYQRLWLKHASGLLSKTTLDSLIETFYNGRCTDPRDRVFALLGLTNVSNGSSTVLLANYTITPTQVYYRTLNHVRHSERLRESTQWTRFKRILAVALEVHLDATYCRADLVYEAAEEDRAFQKPILSSHPDSRELLKARFLDFLKNKISGVFGEKGVPSLRFYHQVIAYVDVFPHEEDPDAWLCFENLLKETLKIASLTATDAFTYVEFDEP
jgi:hypothetical protein